MSWRRWQKCRRHRKHYRREVRTRKRPASKNREARKGRRKRASLFSWLFALLKVRDFVKRSFWLVIKIKHKRVILPPDIRIFIHPRLIVRHTPNSNARDIFAVLPNDLEGPIIDGGLNRFDG